jgi:hypothetical protein
MLSTAAAQDGRCAFCNSNGQRVACNQKSAEVWMNSEKQRRVEERAYALWEADGQLHGKHDEHWHRAAREVEAEETANAAVKRSPRRATGQSTANSGRQSRWRKKKPMA